MESKMYIRETRKGSPQKNVQQTMLLFLLYFCSRLTLSQCTPEATILAFLGALQCGRHRATYNYKDFTYKIQHVEKIIKKMGLATSTFQGGVSDRARSNYAVIILGAEKYEDTMRNL